MNPLPLPLFKKSGAKIDYINLSIFYSNLFPRFFAPLFSKKWISNLFPRFFAPLFSKKWISNLFPGFFAPLFSKKWISNLFPGFFAPLFSKKWIIDFYSPIHRHVCFSLEAHVQNEYIQIVWRVQSHNRNIVLNYEN